MSESKEENEEWKGGNNEEQEKLLPFEQCIICKSDKDIKNSPWHLSLKIDSYFHKKCLEKAIKDKSDEEIIQILKEEFNV